MKQKLFTLLTLLLVGISSAWGALPLSYFSTGTTSMLTYSWGSDNAKNGWRFDTANKLMVWSGGNAIAIDGSNGLKLGNGSRGSAFIFRVENTSNISISVSRYESDVTITLYYLGTSTDISSDPDGIDKTGFANCSSVVLSSSSTTGTLTKTGGSAGYYLVYSTYRFYTPSISVSAATTYTVTYKAGEGTGDDVVDDAAAAVADCPNTFTAPSGKGFSGWNTASDGGGTAYAVGATVTSDLTLYAQWATAYSVSYDSNGADSGSAPTDANKYVNGGTVTVLGNTGSLVKSGYSFIGWNTESDGTGTDYSAGSTFTMSTADVTLYAVWAKNDYSWSQKETSGTVAVDNEVETSVGGKMIVEVATIKYAGTGIEFSSSAAVKVTLNKKMQVGSVIIGTLYYGSTKTDRTLYLKNSAGTTKDTWQLDAVEGELTSKTFTYTVTAGDGMEGSNVFKLVRKNNVYLTSLAVINCIPGEPADPTVDGTTVTLATTANMDGWRSYNNNTSKKYTVSANTKVYYASATGDSKVTLTEIDGGVPANTAVILHKTDAGGAAAEIVLTETATDIDTPASNLLLVSTAGQNLAKVYRLGYKSSDGVGFYTYTTTSAPEGIVYVSSVSSANFLGLDFEDGETTGVASVDKPQTTTNREVYNLAGQRVAQPTKGLYIVNGKKVLVK